jgi:hypothetical protein
MKKDIKFAIRYVPTKQWVKIWFGISLEGYILLMDDFYSDILYSARNICEEDLSYAFWGDGKGRIDLKDFEIVKIEVTYKLPN